MDNRRYLAEKQAEAGKREKAFIDGQIRRIGNGLREYERSERTRDPFFDVLARETLQYEVKDGIYRLVDRRIPTDKIEKDMESWLKQQGCSYTPMMEALFKCIKAELLD